MTFSLGKLRFLRSDGRLALAAFGVAAVVAACGGGGGGGDALPVTAALPSAVSSSYAEGAVSGFGSVIVGGVRYDESKAVVTDDDGNVLPTSALKLGSMVVLGAGVLDRVGNTAQAQWFRVCDELLGPIASIDVAGSTLQVLGQTVIVNASTVFDASLTGGLSALKTGAVIEVQGTQDASSGQITATRIEARAAATAYLLRGSVVALDTGAKSFKIGGALVSYSGLSASSVPATLANGLMVRAVLNTTQTAGAWVATALRSDMRTLGSSGDAHVEGAITAYTSSSAFTIGGITVDASAAQFPDGISGIVLGAHVEVNGVLKNGVLVATQVSLEDGPANGGKRPLELHGSLSALDTAAKTFTLRTVTVWYGGTVSYTGGAASDLANGKTVDVYGVLSSDRTRLEAQRIQFKP